MNSKNSANASHLFWPVFEFGGQERVTFAIIRRCCFCVRSMNHPVDKITEQICAHIFVICINLLRISLRMQRWLSVRYCLWTSNELTFQLNFRKHKHIEPSKRIPNHYCFIVWSTPLQRFHVSQFMRGRNEYIYIYIFLEHFDERLDAKTKQTNKQKANTSVAWSVERKL